MTEPVHASDGVALPDGRCINGIPGRCRTDKPVAQALSDWADLTFAMEPAHRRKLFRLSGPPPGHTALICVGMPGDGGVMAPSLVELIRTRVVPLVSCR